MSDSESSSSGSDSGSSSSSSRSSASSASSKHSAAELARPVSFRTGGTGARESSSDSESSGSDSSHSSKSSKHSEKGELIKKEIVITTSAKKSDSSSSSSSESELSRKSGGSKGSKGRARSQSSLSAASKSSRGASSSESDSASSAEERRPGKVREESSHSEDSSSSSESESDSSSSGSGSSSESGSSVSGSSASSSSASSSSRSSRSSSVSSTQSDAELNRKNRGVNNTDNKDNTENRNEVDHNDVNLVDDSSKKDTLKRTVIDMKDLDEDPAVANNPWVKLGKSTDKMFFSRKFVPLIGTFTILMAVIFSIIIDCKLHGNTHVSYGGSFVPLLIAFIVWAVLFLLMALNRFRYALNIQKLPGEEQKFESSFFNKEGARIGIYICAMLVSLLFFVYLILISAHVDNNKWASWKQAFVPLWIALAFILLGTILMFRLVKRNVTAILILLIGGCVTALLIVIFVRSQGHYGASFSWYKALVPLWLLDFVILILILWHVFARAMFNEMPHFVSTFSKSKKEKPPVDGFGDQFASLPVGIAGVFLLLFQVVIVCKVEGVFDGRYYFSWSIVWLWFWIACAFLEIWVLTYRFRPDPLTAQKLTRV